MQLSAEKEIIIQASTATIDRAMFLRIDTLDRKNYLAGPSACELVATSLVMGKEKGWYDLFGFLILPNEVHMLIAPHRLHPKLIVEHLEAEVHPYLRRMV